MFEPKNTVYWLTYKEYDYPYSDNWINDLYTLYDGLLEEGETFESIMKSVLVNMKKDKNVNYVIVSDTDKIEERKLLNDNFISNNIIIIDNIGNKCYNKEKIGKQIEWILTDFGKEKKMDDKIQNL